MRRITKLNDKWGFIKKDVQVAELDNNQLETVNLPHTWNDIDGQDGGDDYFRGRCWYFKKIDGNLLKNRRKIFLEFRGVNSSATVYVNNEEMVTHHGGYSTFRVDLSDFVNEEEISIAVQVDNSKNDFVYPQRADFTFYGGIYRDVYLISLEDAHFDMDDYGSEGIKVTTIIEGVNADVICEANVTGEATSVEFEIEGVGKTTTDVINGVAKAEINIQNARLWDGTNDPYLYKLKAKLKVQDIDVDEKELNFGCRYFSFDTDNGFLLNGNPYPLRGVSRHQDFKGVGNAITTEMQDLDMELIKEIGANTIRLAHYQHDQYFYDLCDREGMVVWAEIPYITEHLPNGRENTVSQLTELIVQNYNHPSIICWGLSNEITVSGNSEDLLDNHKVLNELAHVLDVTRPTSMAHAFMLGIEDEVMLLPDLSSYNLYYGWYLGDLSDNEKFFDKFREKYPDKVIGLSEYGADANPKIQAAAPERSDYSQQYQCIYHEHILKMVENRPYIWATHVWNMFDFGADGRDEGGEHGVNQKGLITFDRKQKKDAFYLYKAYWSTDSFVHICGENYVKRHEKITEIKVYSNLAEVELFSNGNLIEKKSGDKVFIFNLEVEGDHEIVAKSGKYEHKINITKVDEKFEDYYLKESTVRNWFDEPGMEFIEGYYSIKDTLGDIKKTKEGAALIEKLMATASSKRGDVAKNVKHSKEMEEMIDRNTLEAMFKQASGAITEDMMVEINKALTKIKK